MISNAFIQTKNWKRTILPHYGTEKAVEFRDKTKIAHSFKTRAKFAGIEKKPVKSGKKVWAPLSKSVKKTPRL